MIKEALAAQVAAQERPWPHDRTKTIGASEIGQCARRTWFSKHKHPEDEGYIDRWGAKARGHLIEGLWTKALRRYFGPGHVHYAGRHQRTFIDDEAPLSATPDALVVDRERSLCFVADCKSADPRTNLAEAKPEHIFQIQVQLGLVRHLSRWQPTTGLLSYIDASFLDEVREFPIRWEPAVFQTARARATAIMEAERADDLRPEGVIAGGGECEHCAWRGSCSAIRAGRVPGEQKRVSQETLDVIAVAASERRMVLSSIEQLELRRKELEELIKAAMANAGTRRIDSDVLRVVWSSLKGRPSWNMPALREAAERLGLDLGQFETVGDPSDRLTVTMAGAAVSEKEIAA
jgi:uncharacterized protein (UPF0335 family)